MSERIRVVIAEDQQLVLGALSALLQLDGDFDVVGEAADGVAAFEMVRRERPDLLVADIEMPLLTGIELAQKIAARRLATRVVMVTTFARPAYVRRALEAGAAGYLLKDAPAAELADALRQVHDGGRVVDPELLLEAWVGEDPLTDRQRQVLREAGDGLSAVEIAERQHIAVGTVRNHLSAAIGKLGAANRIEAARIAREKGWL